MVLEAAAAHRGASLVEIYQNCPIFNDGAFDAIKGRDTGGSVIPLVHGEPIRFGDGLCLIRSATGGVEVAVEAAVGAEAVLVHDAHQADPTTAFAISRLTDAGYLNQAPIGIFRQVERPTYDDQTRAQVAGAQVDSTTDPSARLGALIGGGDTWTVL